MDVYEAIRLRRSTRSYKPDPVPQDVLDRLLEAMRLAPSGANRQPWQFIVVRDAEIRKQLVPACWNQEQVAQAPVVIAACGREADAAPSCLVRDLSIALTHLMLAARAEALGTCWIGAFDEGKVKGVLGVPEDVTVVALMTLGYPTAWPEARERKPLDQIVRYDRYSPL
ncbi:MAG: nitroreductase family protein [Armatimonadota bacterium]